MYQPPRIERPRMLRVAEVAQRLDLPQKRVYILTREGIIPHVRLGKSIRFNEAEIEAWIAAGGRGYGDEQEAERAGGSLGGPVWPSNPLMELGLSTRILNSLLEAGVDTVDALRALSLAELRSIGGLGAQSVEVISKRLGRPVPPKAPTSRAAKFREELDALGAWQEHVSWLGDQERSVLESLLGGMTLTEAAARFGRTRERARQIKHKAMRKLMYRARQAEQEEGE